MGCGSLQQQQREEEEEGVKGAGSNEVKGGGGGGMGRGRGQGWRPAWSTTATCRAVTSTGRSSFSRTDRSCSAWWEKQQQEQEQEASAGGEGGISRDVRRQGAEEGGTGTG